MIDDSYDLVTALRHAPRFHGTLDGSADVDIELPIGDLNEVVDLETFRHAWGAVAAKQAEGADIEGFVRRDDGEVRAGAGLKK
jgi:hypothetical protein